MLANLTNQVHTSAETVTIYGKPCRAYRETHERLMTLILAHPIMQQIARDTQLWAGICHQWRGPAIML
jgi:hypothetical protein